MKYIKIYENYKDKIKSKIQFNDFITEYPSGFYMIYKSGSYNWKFNKQNNYLALCRILSPKIFDECIQLNVDIISYICELDQHELKENEKIHIGREIINTYPSSFEKIFISSSLKVSQDKFEELKETTYYQWELNNATNKFNL